MYSLGASGRLPIYPEEGGQDEEDGRRVLGDDLEEAFLKSIISSGFKLPKKNVLISIGGEENRYKFLDSIKRLKQLGFNIFATEHTHKFLEEQGIQSTMVYKVHNPHKKTNILNLLAEKKLDLVINIPKEYEQQQLDDEYKIRRWAVDFSVPLLTNLQIAKLFIDSICKKRIEELKIKSWDEYS